MVLSESVILEYSQGKERNSRSLGAIINWSHIALSQGIQINSRVILGVKWAKVCLEGSLRVQGEGVTKPGQIANKRKKRGESREPLANWSQPLSTSSNLFQPFYHRCFLVLLCCYHYFLSIIIFIIPLPSWASSKGLAGI